MLDIFANDGDGNDGDEESHDLAKFPKEKYPPELVGDIHRFSDLDSAFSSQHHTLGSKHGQASPGDHIHDGGASKGFSYTKFTNGGNPIWVSDGTQPSIGSGVVSARYIKLGTLCFYHWELLFAPNTNLGTGNWEIILPFAARVADGNSSNAFAGTVKGYNGDINTNAVGAMWSASQTRIAIVSHSGTSAWGPTVPFTWNANAGNHLNGSLVYETAS